MFFKYFVKPLATIRALILIITLCNV